MTKMTEGPTARGQAVSSFNRHLQTPGLCRIVCKAVHISPPPHPLTPRAEGSRLEVPVEATLRRQPPHSCQSARPPKIQNRAAMNRNSGGASRR